ncbi:DinB family protein [Saccharopolyspora rosea]|uniref:DinB family protein n=1 Tax=Saccharopolyspora rosea TaxID=524884 RepID=A0ABW3FSP8_9PSEU|nr:DinB family protein [Saccharopolyspora rosea]
MDRTEFLRYADRALDRLAGIVTDLGDETANLRPDLPGANSPYQILIHCLGVVEWWIGHVVADRAVARDRAAEFTATGPVGEVGARVEEAKRTLRSDLAALDPEREVHPEHRSWIPADVRMTHDTVLLHVLEELYQHLGQLEITRDVLRTGRTA